MNRTLVTLVSLSMFVALPAFAAGLKTHRSNVSVNVENGVRIVKDLMPMTIEFDPNDNKTSRVSDTFVVKANSKQTSYNVWLSVDSKHVDQSGSVYVASAEGAQVPFRVRLTGNSGENAVRADAAQVQANGLGATASEGFGVRGTDLHKGTTYTVVLEEDADLSARYAAKKGTYTVNILSHVALSE
jgi:hypothetical protein